VTPSDRALLRARAHATLRANWREGIDVRGIEYAFTCPSPRRYKHQWYWDSCFHAIVWARFEPLRAREELRTLLRAGRPDGFVPHTAFWHARPRWRRAPLYATEHWRGNAATASTQTPLLAFAWERAAQDDAAFAAEALDPLLAHADWLERERDPDGDGLITVLLPDESGLDDSPKYDPVYGRHAHWRPGYFELVERCRRRGWDSRAIIAATDAHVEDVLVNVAHALSLRALARLMAGAGREDDAARLRARATRTERALLERCWDERRGLFLDLAGRDERPVPVSTWSALTPLALGPAIPEETRHRLVEEHLLQPRRYAAPFGIPSVAIEEPAFRPGFDRWRTWRGAAWVNAAWLLVPALDELGYRTAADRIVGSLAAAARRHGFREYYDTLTGRGLGAQGFAWSTLVVDLLESRHACRESGSALP
jgi:mannosylglycerate hydrolase MGH1-like protein